MTSSLSVPKSVTYNNMSANNPVNIINLFYQYFKSIFEPNYISPDYAKDSIPDEYNFKSQRDKSPFIGISNLGWPKNLSYYRQSQ